MSCFMLSRRGGGGFSSRAFSSGRGFGRSPALDLDFTTGKMPARVVHSRASNATQTNAAGTLVNAPHNLLRQSSAMMTSPWTMLSGLTLSNVTGPDGSPNGWSGTLVSGGARFYNQTGSLTTSARYEPSFWVYPISYTGQLTLQNPANATNGQWNLTMASLTLNTWQRITRVHPAVTITAEFTADASGNAGVYFTMNSGQFVGYFAQAQIEANLASSAYVPTTTAAVYGPRLDFDPSTLARKGLLVEAAGTNGVFPSTNWFATQAANGTQDGMTRSVGVAPDGFGTAMALIPGTAVGAHQFFPFIQNGLINTVFTYSVFVKASGFNYFYIGLEGSAFGSNGRNAIFNLATGTIYSQPNGAASATIVPYANGWYRVSVTATSLGTGGNYIPNVQIFDTPSRFGTGWAGDATSGAWVWGNQSEYGYAPTSYIPTTTAIVTRAADIAYVPALGLKGLNGNTGSLFAQMIYEAPNPALGYSGFVYFRALSDRNTSRFLGWYNQQGVSYPAQYQISVPVSTGGSTGAPLSGNISAGVSLRAAITFNSNLAWAAYNNSGARSTGYNTTPPSTLLMDTLFLLGDEGYQPSSSGWLQRITYNPAYLGPTWATNKGNGSIP